MNKILLLFEVDKNFGVGSFFLVNFDYLKNRPWGSSVLSYQHSVGPSFVSKKGKKFFHSREK